MQAGFKVGHHCFKSFGQPTIETVSFQLSHMVGRETVRKKQPGLEGVSIGGCPNPRQSPYLPSVVRTTLGSRYLVPSCYYSVHLGLLTHDPRLYLSWSSIPILWGNFAKIGWHTRGVYDLCILHSNIPLNPTSNSGRSQHPLHPHL